MERLVTPPRRGTSPTWGPPPPCEQALSHRKEIRKLTFRAQALRRIRSDEGLALETSAFESLYGG